MQTAMDKITELLKTTGMDDKEIDHLLGQFLQEEAFTFVEYVAKSLSEINEKAEEIPDLYN